MSWRSFTSSVVVKPVGKRTYNISSMRKILSGVLVFVSLASLAQAPPARTEISCYKDKGIDEYIVELQKLQKKKGTHNPLPNNVCIFGWCRDTGAGPESNPASKTTTLPPQQPVAKPQSADTNESSSKREDAGSPNAPELSSYDPIGAARDTDVGDYYFREKNYRGALMRYADAAKAKPGDAAIHLRMGHGWEKLGAPERAYLEYDAVVKLAPEGEGKTAAEAKEAMQRLTPALQKAGVDPATLVADNHPEKAPCLAPPAPTPGH